MLESGHEGRTELVRAGVDLFIHRFGSPALPVLIVVHGGSTWDHPYLLPGALSRAMAYAGAPFDIWRLDRLEDWHWVLAGIRFSSDWDAPHAAGQLRPAPPRPAPPNDAEGLLKQWAKPVLILHGSREMSFPVSLARKLHAALPASTLAEIPEAAHMAYFDNSQAWLAAIRSFLSPAQ